MGSCLFTNEPLSETTREEHTIPRSLGGRVKSRVVSSNAFNNACGSKVDPRLYEPYAALMCRLGPALAVEHRTGGIDVVDPATGNKYVLDGEGRHGFRGTKVIKDENGTPVTIQGENAERVRRKVEQITQTTLTRPLGRAAAAPVGPMTMKPCPFFTPETEVGVLKSLLLTFDHLLRDTERRFTRHDDFAPVREFVRSSVMGTGAFDLAALNRCSLGLQYEILPEIKEVRQLVDLPRTEFEHVMVVSGDPARRTLDAVWLIADTDPWGLRLADSWRGACFTCVFVNGILRGTSASDPVWLDFPFIECSPTMRRCLPSEFPSEEAIHRERAYSEVLGKRKEAYRRAVWYVEMNCDHAVVQAITEIAILDRDGGHSVLSALTQHLKRLYAFRIEKDRELDRFNSIIERRASGIRKSILAQTVDGSGSNRVDWGTWLPFYRGLLGDMILEFGKPGEIESKYEVVPGWKNGPRALGDFPAPPDLGTGWERSVRRHGGRRPQSE